VDERWEQIAATGTRLIAELNKLDGLSISPIENGSNVYDLRVAKEIDLKKLVDLLHASHNISLRPADADGLVKFKVNETLLSRDPAEILQAWKSVMNMSIV
jgi:threonine aldolase